MANPSQNATSQDQGSSTPVTLAGDRDPNTPTPPPVPSPGMDAAPPSRDGGDEQ
jgi:hypothetical protein